MDGCSLLLWVIIVIIVSYNKTDRVYIMTDLLEKLITKMNDGMVSNDIIDYYQSDIILLIKHKQANIMDVYQCLQDNYRQLIEISDKQAIRKLLDNKT